MIYYLIATFFPILCWGIYCYMDSVGQSELLAKKRKGYLVVLAVLPMILLFALRGRFVGPDTPGYIKFFQTEIKQYTWAQLFQQDTNRQEIGFRLYVKIISLFTDNYTIFFAITAIIVFGVLTRFALKHTGNPFVFIFLFNALGSYSFYMTGLRQTLAMTVCLLGVDFIKDKKLLPFLISVIIGYFFHKSAILFVVAYPFAQLKFNKTTIVIYILLTALLFVSFTSLQQFVNELLGYEYGIEATGNGEIFFVLVTLLFTYCLILNDDVEKMLPKKNHQMLLNLSYVTVVLWGLRLVSRTAERPSLYFMPLLYALITWASCSKKKDNRIYVFIIIYVCGALFVYRNLGLNYSFFWQGA